MVPWYVPRHRAVQDDEQLEPSVLMVLMRLEADWLMSPSEVEETEPS